MLLTITLARNEHAPASELGYLLVKHPSKLHAFELAFGTAYVFYPQVSDDRCTAALFVELDPIGLIRRGVDQYVNDRPYAASSLLSVAIAQTLRTALAGKSKERPELAETALPFEARISALPSRGGPGVLRALFEPLGYQLEAAEIPLDARSPEWGPSPYFDVVLRATKRLSEVLSHLYVLIPVLDDAKHYWVGDEEVEKLLHHGEGWLAAHPAKAMIAERYLKHQKWLAREALSRLIGEEEEIEPLRAAQEEEAIEAPIRLNDQRMEAVVREIHEARASTVIDLGCGEGRLLRELRTDRSISRLTGMDVSHRALELARERLRLDELPDRDRIQLIHGSLLYRDARLEGYDLAAAIEVIEHLDPPRLAAFERAVFEHARPATVLVTTPNAEYNVKFERLAPGRFRHRDHRFEWQRVEFESWARALAERFGYRVRFAPIGPIDQLVGAPTQMAVFAR